MSKRDSGTWLIAFIAGHVLAFGLNWAWGVSFNQPWFAYLVLTVVGVSLSFLVGRKCYGTHNPTCEKVTTPQNPSHPVDTSQSSELETKIGNEASELKASELADLEKVKATPSLDSLL